MLAYKTHRKQQNEVKPNFSRPPQRFQATPEQQQH